MKDNIKYEELSHQLRAEIEKYYNVEKKKDSQLKIEDAMFRWFDEYFDKWVLDNYGDNQANKRKYYRKPMRTAVEYGNKGNSYKDLLQNMSFGGVFIETRMPFRVGEDISMGLVMHASPQKHIKLNGRIVRVSPQGVGVEFKPLNKEQKTLIKSHLEML